VHDNTILAKDYPSGRDAEMLQVGEGRLHRFADRFNQTPGEERGRYLLSVEKNGVVNAKGIPANQEH
jgi:hypothetical protein